MADWVEMWKWFRSPRASACMSEVKKRNKKKKKKKSRCQSTNKKCKSVPAYFTLGGWQKVSPGLKRSTRIAWKELRQLLFSETFGGLSRDAPAKLPAMRRWRNVRTQSETKNHCLPPPCLEKKKKVDDTRKKKWRLWQRRTVQTPVGSGARFSNTNPPTLVRVR